MYIQGGSSLNEFKKETVKNLFDGSNNTFPAIKNSQHTFFLNLLNILLLLDKIFYPSHFFCKFRKSI